jgi:hypothetical protein
MSIIRIESDRAQTTVASHSIICMDSHNTEAVDANAS